MNRKARRAVCEIQLKRAYEPAAADDGYRVLVDRYWPRGVSREALVLDDWARDLAPNAELIRWFGHAPERWNEFRSRYRSWLAQEPQLARLKSVFEAAMGRRITLVFGARNAHQNQAVVVREALLDLE